MKDSPCCTQVINYNIQRLVLFFVCVGLFIVRFSKLMCRLWPSQIQVDFFIDVQTELMHSVKYLASQGTTPHIFQGLHISWAFCDLGCLCSYVRIFARSVVIKHRPSGTPPSAAGVGGRTMSGGSFFWRSFLGDCYDIYMRVDANTISKAFFWRRLPWKCDY